MKPRTPCSGRIVLAALLAIGVAGTAPAQIASAAGGSAVTVTLVRWPYT